MNNATLLTILAFYTLIVVGGIHYYEDKIKDLNNAIGDYQRAINLLKSHSNAEHYTQLQIHNQELLKRITKLENERKKETPIRHFLV